MKTLIRPVTKRLHGIMLLLGVAPVVTADSPDPGMKIARGNTALVNFRFLANDVIDTKEAVSAMRKSASHKQENRR